jgi:hypothetical protein
VTSMIGLSSHDLLEIINIVIITIGGQPKKENHIIDGAGLTSTVMPGSTTLQQIPIIYIIFPKNSLI